MNLTSELISEAIMDDDLFAQLPKIIARTVDSRSCLIHFVDNKDGHRVLADSGDWNDSDGTLYANHVDKDLGLKAMQLPQNLNKFNDIYGNIVSENEFANSEINYEFYRKIGDDMRFALGMAINTNYGQGAIGIHRGKYAKPFEQQSLEKLNILSRQLSLMLGIRAKIAVLEQNNHALKQVVEAEEYAWLKVTQGLKVKSFNKLAENMLDKGMPIYIKDGMLGANFEEPNNFTEAIQRPILFDNLCNFFAKDLFGVKYEVIIFPNYGNNYSNLRQLFIKRVEPKKIEYSDLIEKYRLTKTEFEIAKFMIQGFSIEIIAQLRRVSKETIRSHVKTIYQKTETNSQLNLIRRFNNL